MTSRSVLTIRQGPLASRMKGRTETSSSPGGPAEVDQPPGALVAQDLLRVAQVGIDDCGALIPREGSLAVRDRDWSTSTQATREPGLTCWATLYTFLWVRMPEPISRNWPTPAATTNRTARPGKSRLARAIARTLESVAASDRPRSWMEQQPWPAGRPPGFPLEYERHVMLPGGRRVRIRPILPSDAPELAEALKTADAKGAAAGCSHVHHGIARRVRRPAVLRQHRHAYAADFQRGLPARGQKPASELPLRQGGPRTAPKPISVRFELVSRLRSFVTGSLALRLLIPLAEPGPSDGVRPVPAFLDCFPPSPASPGPGCLQLLPDRCDGPAVESSHLHSIPVRSIRGALPVLPSVGFPGSPPAPGVHLSAHRALHKPRRAWRFASYCARPW
jgi:hypothetical protein